MSLKTRLEKLEEALPDRGGSIRIIWHSSVRRDADGLLWERPFQATRVNPPLEENQTLTRRDDETAAAFLNRVMAPVRGVDPASEDEVRWQPAPDTHHIE